MDYAIAPTKHYTKFPACFSKARKIDSLLVPSELAQLSIDRWIDVLSFVDGGSVYQFGCVNSQYDYPSSYYE